MARVSQFPLTINADSHFNEEEKKGIQQAIDQWNTFGQVTAKTDLFNLNFVELPEVAKYSNADSCASFDGNDRSFVIVKEQDPMHWQSLGFTKYIPGVTFRCKSSDLVLTQIIFIEDEILDPTQVSSVVVHELGHALGLDHSCSGGPGSPDYKACQTLAASDPYYAAVMYPSLSLANATSGKPEIKAALGENDKLRTQCLYH